jgi:cobalt-zinc-cadmium efflux system outer membrane protein
LGRGEITIYKAIALLAVVLLGACAEKPLDRGAEKVSKSLNQRGMASANFHREDPEPSGPFLSNNLSVTSAVQIAMINNPRVRMGYARLGIAATEVYDAARLSIGALDSSARGAGAQITLGVVQNFTDLILRKPRKRLAKSAAKQIRYAVAAEIFNLVQDVTNAYFSYLVASQTAKLRELQVNATGLAATLAERHFAKANINRLELSLSVA